MDRITVLAWPGLDLPLLLAPGVSLGRARRQDAEFATVDSTDRCLARAGITVTTAGDRWSIDVAGCGSTRIGTGSDAEPVDEEVLRVVGAVSRGRELRNAVRERRRGRLFPLLVNVVDEPAGAVETLEVGYLRDDDVSLVDGRRVVSRQRQLTVEAEGWVVDWIRHRLDGLGLAEQEVLTTVLSAPLGPPDPMPWPLTRVHDTRTVLQRGLARATGELLRHDPVVRLDLHVEGVHGMRVAVRTLRSLLWTFEALFEPPAAPTDDLRWISRLLGRVRDLDVLRETVQSALQSLPLRERELGQFVLEEIAAERAGRLGELTAAMSTKRYATLLDRLVVLAESPSLVREADRPPARVMLPIARRAYRRLRKSAKLAAEDGASVDAVHMVRLAAKRFRYVLDTVAEVIPPAAAQAKELARLQQVLGRFNDAANAEEWLTKRVAHETDVHRAFLLGGLVTEVRRARDEHRSRWMKAWARVKAPERAAWLED